MLGPAEWSGKRCGALTIRAPTFRMFLEQADQLSKYERDKVILYHAIRERQAAGDWTDWVGESA